MQLGALYYAIINSRRYLDIVFYKILARKVNKLRENYHSFSYWENIINENKTIRGHMFMQKPPTKDSVYFHTIIFGSKNGINNIWGYCHNIRCLIGYIQYSFLQEAFYKWIHGKDKLVTKIPHLTIDKIADEGHKLNKINKEISISMKNDYEFLNSLWRLPSDKIEIELRKFMLAFNKKWKGDNKEFLYIKILKTPEELGEFVISSTLLASTAEELESRIGMTLEEWRKLCKFATRDFTSGEMFRNILLKKLSEVF